MPLRFIGIHLLFLLSLPLLAQDSQKHAPGPNKLYEFRDDHDPNGIGKFYMGREIANVMSHLGAGWLERPEREKEEHTSMLLPPLKIKPRYAPRVKSTPSIFSRRCWPSSASGPGPKA